MIVWLMPKYSIRSVTAQWINNHDMRTFLAPVADKGSVTKIVRENIVKKADSYRRKQTLHGLRRAFCNA
jgi:hypothetical protein